MNRITVDRTANNPILQPQSNLPWESEATFNPSVIAENGKYHMAYRALSNQQEHQGQTLNLSTVGIVSAPDNDNFIHHDHRQLIVPDQEFDQYGCEDPRLTKIDDEYFIFYTGLSSWPPDSNSIKVAVALSDDLKTVNEKHLVTPFNAKAMVLFPEKINGQYVALLTVNTDQPPAQVAIARFDRKEQIWDTDFWSEWYNNLHHHILDLPRFNTDHVEVGAVPVKTDQGWILIYSHIQNYLQPEKRTFGIEAALLDLQDPQQIIGRTNQPLLVPEKEYELKGVVSNVIFPSGAVIVDDELVIYYGAADTVGAVAKVKLNFFLSLLKNSSDQGVLKFHKYEGNPILTPRDDQPWQAQAVFNGAAIYENDHFYLFYRAMSWDNTSTIGCAISTDGYNFSQLSQEPVYVPRMRFESKSRPNAFSGCEDPRITKFGDRFYLFYTAYDGKTPPQVAISSIKEQDFLAHNWMWTEPISVSSPHVDNKNSCLFPEKIDGRFVVLHRVAGRDIALDFVHDLTDLKDQGGWLEKEAAFSPRPDQWDSAKIGVAGPPLKTEAGWLLIYHGVSRFDKNYRLGYMILDLHDPFNVLFRSKYPILEPQLEFEKKGIVDNVVFSCGAVEKDGLVYLYYGGADKVMAVATMELSRLLAVV